ncbi:MAG: hypothetical protein M1504_01605 [Candidatus Marsarchaeota archaeon]|nr:hypothetical protein [Candidatus Marsarchaeota archaeon]
MATKNRRETRKKRTTAAKALKKAKTRPATKSKTVKNKKMNLGLDEYQPIHLEDVPTYQETVIRNIIESSNASKNVPDEALLFSAALSSVSQSSKELQYRSGISVGRNLYRFDASKRDYTFPEESIADLVSFLEASGYKYVTYSANPGNIEVNIHKTGSNVNMGTNLHAFEAGIISGFVGAAERRMVNIQETECAYNNGERCRFRIADSAQQNVEVNGGDIATISNLITHIGNSARLDAARDNVSTGYYSLASNLLVDRTYLEHMRSIAGYIGVSVGSELFRNKNRTRYAIGTILRTIKLLNFGNPMVESIKPFHLRLSFDGLTSRREFVDVSLSFVNGLLSTGFGKDMVAIERNSNGRYVVDIKEEKK